MSGRQNKELGSSFVAVTSHTGNVYFWDLAAGGVQMNCPNKTELNICCICGQAGQTCGYLKKIRRLQ